jgi:hypothetical protein
MTTNSIAIFSRGLAAQRRHPLAGGVQLVQLHLKQARPKPGEVGDEALELGVLEHATVACAGGIARLFDAHAGGADGGAR